MARSPQSDRDDAVDQSRATEAALLPGETADSDVADDAEHWIAVYEELTGFLSEIDPPEEAIEHYRRRLEHWRCRRDQLRGRGGDDVTGRR